MEPGATRSLPSGWRTAVKVRPGTRNAAVLPALLALAAMAGTALAGDGAGRDPIDRIAFGSCAYQWQEQPILDQVVASGADIFLYLGDAIYGDWDGEKAVEVTPASLAAEWAKLARVPQFQRLRDAVPILATWDNHDYGHHSAGAEFPLKAESQEIFLDFFGEPADSGRRQTPGIYTARVLGPPGRRVQILMLDTRFFKGPPVLADRPEGTGGSLGKYAPNPDPEVTLLGDAQWRWLEHELRQPAEVRLIASSTQIVADRKGMDEWGNYPHERRRLFDVIEATGASGVILLSGNVHLAEVSETDEGPYPLHDFTSSGLTHVNETYAEVPNLHRVAGPCVDPNFGLVEIDWESSPLVTLRAIGIDGTVAFEHEVSLAALRATPGDHR
jgi:alkaline phosphatase D